jgi:hypothetical protein
MVAVVIASGILAWLTYRYVERPIRFAKSRSYAKIAALVAGMVAVGAVGLVADKTGGLPIRIPEEIRGYMLTGAETSAYWRRGQCLLLPDQRASDFTDECSGSSGKRPLLLVWGDSYAAALYAGLDRLSEKHGYDVAEYTASACPPMIGYVNGERRFCKPINDFVIKKIAEIKPDVVILHSTWSYDANDLNVGLQETVRQLKELKIRKIVLLGPVASWKGDGLAANVLDYFYESGHSLIPARTTYRSNDEWTRALEQFLQKRAQELDIEYISARKVMCNDEGCLSRIGKDGSDLTAFDGGHLTLPGSVYLSGAILDRLLDLKQ